MKRLRHGWAATVMGLAALAGPGMTAGAQAQILVGQTVGITGAAAATVRESTEGAMLYLNHVNARGGVNGQKIEMLRMDDKFDPKLAVENARVLIEEKNVVAMFMSRGTPHTEGINAVLEKNAIALIGPSTGAMVLHQPVKRYIFNVRATYQREVEKAIVHLASLGVNRIGVVHVDDTFGADGLAGAQKGFATAKLEPLFVEKFDRSKPDFTKIAPAMAKKTPQAIIFVGTGTAVVSGIEAIRAAGSAAQIVTLSNNASGGFVKSLGTMARGVLVTQVFPYERSFAYPMVKEAVGLAKAAGSADISPAMLEGFAAAKVLVEGLNRAGPKPTREKLLQALDNMRRYDLGGLEVSYSPTDHTGLDFADLSIIGQDGRFRR